MLMAAPPRRDEEALLTVVRSLSRFDWDRFLLVWCVAFHAAVAFTLAAAPDTQLLTPGTRPVLELASRYVWAVVFAVLAVAVAFQWHPRGRRWQAVAWLPMLFVGGTWMTALGLAILAGKGSAVQLLLWVFLYGIWCVLAARALRKR